MGSVYAAVDESTGARIALKRLHETRPNDTRWGLFEREFHTLSSLRHPRIVEVYDYGVDEGGAYYTMELLEGADLSGAGPMPWQDVAGCLRDVSSILGVLHSRRLVYRDLSPRNLWRCADGRLKLIDFGALSPFGPALEAVGTPPLAAPETVDGHSLDARTDVYSLGALGYWLLTGVHAFPAKQMAALPALWEHDPVPPAQLVALIKSLPQDIPAGLDALILHCLRRAPNDRPQSVAEVVDALNAIAQLAPESRDIVHAGYLGTTAFVGRRKQRARFEGALARAKRGQPGAMWFEGAPGQGRTRLLTELGLMARLSGACVLCPRTRDRARPYGWMVELARSLVTALPEAASRAARTGDAELRRLAEALRTRDERSLALRNADHDENAYRSEWITRLGSWLKAVSEDHTLVIFVDDIERIDEPSQSLLSSLALDAGTHRSLLVASAPTALEASAMSALGALRSASRRLSLEPLSEVQTRELLGSCFGEAEHLERLSARLYAASSGNPAHLRMLVEHLVRTAAIEYLEGAWVLPFDLPDDLPANLDDGALARLDLLPPEARDLACVLALPECAGLSREALQHVCGSGDRLELESRLAALRAGEFLDPSVDTPRLSNARVQAQLAGRLPEARRVSIHRSLAEWLEAHEPGAFPQQLRIALHHLYAGDLELGQRKLARTMREMMVGNDISGIRARADALETAHALLHELGADDDALTPTLVGLSVCGYLADGSFAVRYGEETTRVLGRVLRMQLASRLRRFLGSKLSLLITLAVAGFGLRMRRAPMGLLEVVRWYVSVLGTLSGAAATFVDPARIRAYARALEPFAALGPDHVAGFMHRYVVGLAEVSEDRPATSYATLDACLARLRSNVPMKALTETTRSYLIGGILYANGIRENLALREASLVTADALAELGPMQAMQAEYLRVGYHLYRGQVVEAQEHRRRLERQAIALGSSWQAETTAPTQDMIAATYRFDAVGMKRAAQQLGRARRRSASMGHFERDARASYQLLRDRFDEAAQLLSEAPDESRGSTGWARRQGQLAQAHNALGRHQDALDACDSALSNMEEGDLDYVMFGIEPLAQRCRALAGLGRRQQARQQLEKLRKRYGARSPLIAGYLHQVSAQVALDADELEQAAEHIEAADAAYACLQIPSLRARVSRLRRDLRKVSDPDSGEHVGQLLADDTHLMTRVQLVMTHAGEQLSDRLEVGLKLARDFTTSAGCALILHGLSEPTTTCGSELPDEVLLWARERLAACLADDETETDDGGDSGEDRNLLTFRDGHYALSILWHAGVSRPLAALVLAFEDAHTRLPPDALRRVLAAQLWDADVGSELSQSHHGQV